MAKKKQEGWLKKLTHVSTTVKVLVPILSVFGLFGAAVLWLFSTFATAGQVEDIKQQIRQQGAEVKIIILEGRREALVKELVGLETRKARTQEEHERLGIIREQIKRIDRQLRVLEEQQLKK